MANESKQHKTPSSSAAGAPSDPSAPDLPEEEIIFPGDPSWTVWVNSVTPEALKNCLQHLSEAGPDLDTSANQKAISAVTHNLAKLDEGIIALNKSSLSPERKQAVLASMIANPFFAKGIADIGILLNQLNGDFLEDFSSVKEIMHRDEFNRFQIYDALKMLADNGFLNPQHRNEWFGCVINDAVDQTKRHAQYAFHMAGFYVLLKKNGLLTGGIAGGKNNLERLKAIGGSRRLAAAFSSICDALNRVGCLTQDNLNALLNLVEKPAMRERLQVIALAMNSAEGAKFTTLQDKQKFLIRLIQSPVMVAGEVKKDNKLENKSQQVSLSQSLNTQRIDKLNTELQGALPILPAELRSLISAYAVNYYNAEDDKQLLLAQQNVEAQNEAGIRYHIKQDICNGWLNVFIYYVEKGYIRPDDVLVEGVPEERMMHLLPQSHRLVDISTNEALQNRTGRFYSYLILALENKQMDMARLIIEYCKNYPNRNLGINTVDITWGPPANIGEIPESERGFFASETGIVCRFKGSVFQRAIVEKDGALVQLLATNGGSSLCAEYPVGTTFYYARFKEQPPIVRYPVGTSQDYLNAEGQPNSLLYMAAVLWKEAILRKAEDAPERMAIFAMLVQNLPASYTIHPREARLITQVAERWLLSSPQAAPVKAPEGRQGFLAPPRDTPPALDATGIPAIPDASAPRDRKDGL